MKRKQIATVITAMTIVLGITACGSGNVSAETENKEQTEHPKVICHCLQHGYLIPDITYKYCEQMEQLGKYGFLRRDYLKNHNTSHNSQSQTVPNSLGHNGSQILHKIISTHLLIMEVDFCLVL